MSGLSRASQRKWSLLHLSFSQYSTKAGLASGQGNNEETAGTLSWLITRLRKIYCQLCQIVAIYPGFIYLFVNAPNFS